MKKAAIMTSLLLIGFVNAQLKYGISARFQRSSTVGIHNVSKGNYGGSIGGFVEIPLVSSDICDEGWLYFVPQLEFSFQGEKADWSEQQLTPRQQYNDSYVAIPLYIKYFFHSFRNKSDIYIMLGPKFEFLVSEKRSGEEEAINGVISTTGQDPRLYGLGERIAKSGYGASAVVGIRLNDYWDMFVRFDRGFSKVYPDYSAEYLNTYNRLLGVGINYYIGGNRCNARCKCN